MSLEMSSVALRGGRVSEPVTQWEGANLQTVKKLANEPVAYGEKNPTYILLSNPTGDGALKASVASHFSLGAFYILFNSLALVIFFSFRLLHCASHTQLIQIITRPLIKSTLKYIQ